MFLKSFFLKSSVIEKKKKKRKNAAPRLKKEATYQLHA
jgi:hypothetical protein